MHITNPLMKPFKIAHKTLLEYLREPLLLGLLFLFPLMLLGFYYIAFGGTDQGLAKYLIVWAVNEDIGGTTSEGEHWQAGEQLLNLMRGIQFEDEPVFDITVVSDRRLAEISVRERKVSLLLIIPTDFAQAILEAVSAAPDKYGGAPAVVSLIGYPNSDNFVFAQSLVEEMVHEFTGYAIGRKDHPLVIDYEFLPGTGTMSDFEFGVPGVIVFGIMFVTISTAMSMVRENVSGTLQRLRLTCVNARDLLLGVTLAQMAVALVIVPVTLGAAVVMGFRGHGSYLLALGVGLLLSVSAVGLGLIVACFARTDSEAANMSATVGVLMVIVSGAMYTLPDAPLVTMAGRNIQVYDLLPPTHAAEAMRKVLVLGQGPGEITYELAGLTILAAVILAVGVALYQRLQLQRK